MANGNEENLEFSSYEIDAVGEILNIRRQRLFRSF